MKLLICVASLALACSSDPAPSGSPDGAPGGDAAPDGQDTGGTPLDTWTWVEIPGSQCGNGSPAGIGINRSAVSPDLYVYFQGGGACWDGETCFVDKTSVHIEDTYTAETLEAEGISGMIDHDVAGNPLANATFVYVPYCTGDLHAGTTSTDYLVAEQTRSVAHVGGRNAQLFVEALLASFPQAQTVWLAGSSAGGFGATFNHHRFVAAYPSAEVHVLQDGAPFLPVLENYETWQSSWSLAFPPNCAGCEAGLPAVMDAVSSANPSSRFGLLHFDDDTIIKIFWGYPTTTGSLLAATDALLAEQYDLANTKAFVIAGQSHTMLGQLESLVGPGGVRLADWVEQWATGDPAWATVR